MLVYGRRGSLFLFEKDSPEYLIFTGTRRQITRTAEPEFPIHKSGVPSLSVFPSLPAQSCCLLVGSQPHAKPQAKGSKGSYHAAATTEAALCTPWPANSKFPPERGLSRFNVVSSRIDDRNKPFSIEGDREAAKKAIY